MGSDRTELTAEAWLSEKREQREAEKREHREAEKTERQEAKKDEHEQSVATTEHKEGHHGQGKGSKTK